MDYFVETEKGLVVELPDDPEKMPAKSLYLLNHSSWSHIQQSAQRISLIDLGQLRQLYKTYAHYFNFGIKKIEDEGNRIIECFPDYNLRLILLMN